MKNPLTTTTHFLSCYKLCHFKDSFIALLVKNIILDDILLLLCYLVSENTNFFSFYLFFTHN